MLSASGRVKAAYVPRSAGGSEPSKMENSRTETSLICIRAGAIGGGLASVSQPGGVSAGSARSTSRLWVESAARASEYGSVTLVVTTRWAAGCHTSIR